MNPFLARLQKALSASPERASPEQRQRPAICSRGRQVFTYGELLTSAQQVADELIAQGVGPGQVLPIAREKSPDYIVHLLGIWLAGAAFVPLRPSLPRAHRDRVLRELHEPPDLPLEDAAYLIYTSGSSGQPRGVAVGHGGILPFVDAQITTFELTPQSQVLWYLSPDFDASLSDLLTALLAGACLHLEDDDALKAPAALIGILRDREITHVDLPPSVLTALDPELSPPTLQTLIIGGEVCPPETVRSWARRVRVVNCYGPTEATVCTSMVVCDPTWDRPFIGHPIPGVTYDVRRPDGATAQVGESGELWITGDAVAIGYLHHPDETARRFPTPRTFRTGDLLRVHPEGQYPEGNLEFLGRLDRRVKVAGKMISPEPIEASLASHPAVRRAAVVPRELPHGTALVAFLEASGEPPDLPPIDTPIRTVVLESLPTTPTGKVDLPALQRHPLNTSAGRSIHTPVEALLIRLFAQVLGTTDVSPDDDFFALGGDSLSALHLSALASRHGLSLPPELLRTAPRVRSLATAVRAPRPPRTTQSLRELARELAADLPPVVTSPTSEPRQIFLTGATGSLGSLLLSRLLDHTDAHITCLVRGPSQEAAARRLPHPSPRVTVLQGDISLPNLGLSPDRYAELTDTTDTIYHLAAAVNLGATFDDLRATNLDGTLEILRLLTLGRPKTLHNASTLSVFVGTDRSPGPVLPEPLRSEGVVHGGYAQSKWAAEWLVHHVAPTARIYRLGLLVGDRPHARDMLDHFFRGTAALGCVPDEHLDTLEFDITPLETAADAIADAITDGALADSPQNPFTHIAAPRPYSLRFLMESMQAAGIPIEPVPTEVWRDRLLSHPDPTLSGLLLAMCRCLGPDAYDRWRPFDLFQATGFSFPTRE